MNKSMKKIGKTLVSVSLAAAMAVTMASSASAYCFNTLGCIGKISNTYARGSWYTWDAAGSDYAKASNQFPEIQGKFLDNQPATDDFTIWYQPLEYANGFIPPVLYGGEGVVAAVLRTTNEYTAKAATDNFHAKGTDFRWLALEQGSYQNEFALRNTLKEPKANYTKYSIYSSNNSYAYVTATFEVAGCYAGLDLNVTDENGQVWKTLSKDVKGSWEDGDYTTSFRVRGKVIKNGAASKTVKLTAKPVSGVYVENTNSLYTGRGTSKNVTITF